MRAFTKKLDISNYYLFVTYTFNPDYNCEVNPHYAINYYLIYTYTFHDTLLPHHSQLLIKKSKVFLNFGLAPAAFLAS
jgi:hypothetical protein